MRKMAIKPDWLTSGPQMRKCPYSRPHSSPCRLYSKNVFQDMFRPSSSTPAVANPILSFLDVKRILFQKITDRGDELKKAFQLLDPGQNLTVSKNELRRTITGFLMPLTREQFQDVLAQIPLTRSGAVPYLEFLSRFGGIDLNINVLKKGSENEMNCCRTLKELEIQIGEKVFKNIKTIIKAFNLIDVNKTGLIQPHELRRVLETFCLKFRDEEYCKFSKHYNIDKEPTVDYNAFLKNLSINNDLNLRYYMINQDVSCEHQQGKSPKKEHLLNYMSSKDVWKYYTLDELGSAFYQEFSKSFEKIEKALSAGDPAKSGYVSFNYLKVVLDTFICQLPRRVFIQLMKRFGLKATTKINWKQFLTSFQEPQDMDINIMVPPRKRNSINSRNQSCKKDTVTKLFTRSDDRFASLKTALLIINAKTNGQISEQELRQVLDNKVIKLNDADFKELMQTLDPGGTGMAKVSTFIDLLEENPKMRKISPCTDRTPLLLAWGSVEEAVREAINRSPQAFYSMLRTSDTADTGILGRSNFKRIMLIFCPFLTNKHFVRLCSKFQDIASGGILYKKLLESLGINVLPTVSSAPAPKDPFCAHFHKAEQEHLDLSERTKPTKEKTTPAKNMTKEEVIEKLKNCIQQQDPAFRRRFLDFGKEPNGKISVREFRKVLEDTGMPMDDDQYALLTRKIGYKEEGMSYLDFATGFEDIPRSGPEASPPQTPVYSKSRQNSHFITAEECLKLFPKRLKEEFRDSYSAFFKMDTDMDGIISMRDLHRLLLQMLLNLKDEEFERFLALLGLRLSVTLNFREFRNLCEKRPFRGDERPQRIIRPKQKVTDSDLACEQAHQYLATKAKNRWLDLSKHFLETDSEGNGILRRWDIKNALYGFDIPLTPKEFEKLWLSYDTEGKGHITYQEFVQKLGINYSPTSHRPYAEDYFNFMGHFTKPQQIQEEIKELQQSSEKAAPARDKLMDHYQDISKALAKIDKSKNGYISIHKLQKVLQECGCPLKEEELTNLLTRTSWGIGWPNNSVSYPDFWRALENSKPRPPAKEKEENLLVDFSTLPPEEVVRTIQDVVDSAHPALLKAFSALDKEDTGFVKAAEFGQVIKDFCYKLTDNQYHYFLRKLRIHLVPYINWKYFLQNFSYYLEETADEWAEKMPKGPLLSSPVDMATKDLLARLHKAVTSHYYAITQEFDKFDTTKTNTISKEEFRAICTRHVQILTDDQFNRLWNEMPVNTKGRLRCLDFLCRFSSERPATPPAAGDSSEAQRGSSVPELSERARSAMSAAAPQDLRVGLKSRSHPCTPASSMASPSALPLQNCEPIESKLRRRIQGCWRQLLKECKEKDPNKHGEITAAEFLAFVEKFSLDISKEECHQLMVKYDLRNNGKFAYPDFIQSCVLMLKTKETSLLQRLKIQNANKMKEAGAETSSFYSALLRIQPKIMHCWRPMRRTFKTYDEAGTGLLNVADFRRVLRQYSINLSEEEFFHILEHYDKTLSSKISYNDFLRAFLQ
uniref:EF-hand calcium-binding domain-containing protein 6 n=1 Tax=Otolemur garnettii TaxID=30611 RepID=H0WJE7_OTOGA